MRYISGKLTLMVDFKDVLKRALRINAPASIFGVVYLKKRLNFGRLLKGFKSQVPLNHSKTNVSYL